MVNSGQSRILLRTITVCGSNRRERYGTVLVLPVEAAEVMNAGGDHVVVDIFRQVIGSLSRIPRTHFANERRFNIATPSPFCLYYIQRRGILQCTLCTILQKFFVYYKLFRYFVYFAASSVRVTRTFRLGSPPMPPAWYRRKKGTRPLRNKLQCGLLHTGIVLSWEPLPFCFAMVLL